MTQSSIHEQLKELERRHEELSTWLTAAIDSAVDGMILIDEQGRIRAVNQAFKKIYGCEGYDLVGMNIQQIQQYAHCCMAQARELQQFFQELFTSEGAVVRRELNLVQPQPRTIWFYSRPVMDSSGKRLGRLSLHTDVTAEKKLNEEIRDMAEFSEACPFPVIRCDRKGNVLYMNPAFRSMLDQVRLPVEKASQLLPPDVQVHIDELLKNHSTAFDLKGEFRGRILEFTFAPFRVKEQVFVIVNDLTEQKRAEQKILDYARELEEVNRQIKEAQTQLIQSEKMASLGLLVAGIAHEINTPIGSINSNNDILIRSVSKMRDFLNCEQCPMEVRQNPEVVKIMGILEEINRNNRIACDRIMNMIRSLKNFARLDEAERKRVDIHDGIESTLTLVHHQLKNRIEVVKEYGTLPEIECYPNRLNQVFMNILVNAEQAIRGKGTITIRTQQEGNWVKVMISDTGSGISPENVSKIFDPGFTTKGVGVGTGLGLSICYKIIQDHRGTIHVESELGKGTTFTITLPILLSRSQNAPS
ncbi:MAG: ATP-binding protein [Acidobacteriota bacterium]